jgi:hypothetical protein
MNVFYFAIVLLLSTFQIRPQSNFSEKEYSDHIHYLLVEERDNWIKSGSVELLTNTNAFEIDRAANLKQFKKNQL